MLANEGYRVVHLTRHCGMEHGKDVIAISPSGDVCAYQLKGKKGGKIKLKEYQEELLGQITQLVFTPVAHPSVPFPNKHLAYFVTNGEMEEEVFREIDNFNKNWVLNGQPQYQLKTIVKGELLKKALNLKTDLVPTEIKDFRLLIDFHLNNGRGVLEKGEFAKLIEGHFNKNQVGEKEARRIISSGALLCALATASYTNQNNHVAIIEAWTIYISYLLRFAEINSLAQACYKSEVCIAEEIIVNSLESLLDELKERKNCIEGGVAEDAFLHGFRITWLIGLVSYLAIYYHLKKEVVNSTTLFSITGFIDKFQKDKQVWGDGAIPNFIMHFWLREAYRFENASAILKEAAELLLEGISDEAVLYTCPYDGIEASLSFLFSDDTKEQSIQLLHNESYYLWPLIVLLTDKREKEYLRTKWPQVSITRFKYFQPEVPADLYKWRNQNGRYVSTPPSTPETWENLLKHTHSVDEKWLPGLLKEHTWFCPLFLMVFPHRVTKDLVLFIHKTIAFHIDAQPI